jgi:hypothetical protein
VNLDHRIDRAQHMYAECKRVGLNAYRFSAVLPEEYKGPASAIAGMLARPQRGAVGCYLSQRMILGEALFGEKNILVLEDDVVFCDDLRARFDYLEEHLPEVDPEWDIMDLGGTYHVNPPVWHKDGPLGRDAARTSDPRIMRVYGAWSTYAWLVRRESLAYVIASLDEVMPRAWGIDHGIILLGDRLRRYAFVPGMAKQMDGQSDIGSGITMFSGFAALGKHWWAPRMEDVDPESISWGEAAR